MSNHGRIVLPFKTRKDYEDVAAFIQCLRFAGVDFNAEVEDGYMVLVVV